MTDNKQNTTTSIYKLDGRHELPSELVGGKALNLNWLCHEGFIIPEAVVLPGNQPVDEAAHLQIARFLDKIHAQYGSETRFSIRSSAAQEDGLKHSYAGMFQSYLDVDKSDVYWRVLMCRNYQSHRLQHYAPSADINTIAVIIQRMLEPSISGVAFTMDPVNNSYDRIVVEYTTGTAEKLVGGVITPSSLTLRKQGLAVLFQEIEDNNVLQTEKAKLLGRLLIHMETLTGYPVDVEFAFEGKTLYFLQMRPVTT